MVDVAVVGVAGVVVVVGGGVEVVVVVLVVVVVAVVVVVLVVVVGVVVIVSAVAVILKPGPAECAERSAAPPGNGVPDGISIVFANVSNIKYSCFLLLFQ